MDSAKSQSVRAQNRAERARSCDFDELVAELLLQRGVIVLAEAGRVELQEQAIQAK